MTKKYNSGQASLYFIIFIPNLVICLAFFAWIAIETRHLHAVQKTCEVNLNFYLNNIQSQIKQLEKINPLAVKLYELQNKLSYGVANPIIAKLYANLYKLRLDLESAQKSLILNFNIQNKINKNTLFYRLETEYSDLSKIDKKSIVRRHIIDQTGSSDLQIIKEIQTIFPPYGPKQNFETLQTISVIANLKSAQEGILKTVFKNTIFRTDKCRGTLHGEWPNYKIRIF